jgi:hypothetical protein
VKIKKTIERIKKFLGLKPKSYKIAMNSLLEIKSKLELLEKDEQFLQKIEVKDSCCYNLACVSLTTIKDKLNLINKEC